jgi:hypothetical protein
VRATGDGDLNEINGWIHDAWFCVSGIEYDMQASRAEIPFVYEVLDAKRRVGGRWLKVFEVPKVAATLTVENVVETQVGDDQGIDCYDFNVLKYDEQRGRLTFETGIPNEMWMAVRELDLRLEITSREVGFDRRRSLFG